MIATLRNPVLRVRDESEVLAHVIKLVKRYRPDDDLDDLEGRYRKEVVVVFTGTEPEARSDDVQSALVTWHSLPFSVVCSVVVTRLGRIDGDAWLYRAEVIEP